MHKNAIKIVWGVKNCAPFTKNMALFGGKKFVHLFVRFLAKLGAPLSSELLDTLASVARIGVLTPNGCFLTSVWCAKFWVGVFIKKGDFSNIFKYKGENMQISYFCSDL